MDVYLLKIKIYVEIKISQISHKTILHKNLVFVVYLAIEIDLFLFCYHMFK